MCKLENENYIIIFFSYTLIIIGFIELDSLIWWENATTKIDKVN
jgi:hypothetical protein